MEFPRILHHSRSWGEGGVTSKMIEAKLRVINEYRINLFYTGAGGRWGVFREVDGVNEMCEVYAEFKVLRYDTTFCLQLCLAMNLRFQCYNVNSV